MNVCFSFCYGRCWFKLWNQTRHLVLHFLKVRNWGAALQRRCPSPLPKQLTAPGQVFRREGSCAGSFQGCFSSGCLSKYSWTTSPSVTRFSQDLQKPTLKSKESSLQVSKCYLQDIFRLLEFKVPGLNLCMMSSSLWRCCWAGTQDGYAPLSPLQVRIRKRSAVWVRQA